VESPDSPVLRLGRIFDSSVANLLAFEYPWRRHDKPYATSRCAARAWTGRPHHIQKVSAALVELLREMRIQVWEGFWYEEPKHISGESAEAVLGDMRRFSFDAEAADGLKRVYYVNVNNIRAEHQ